MTAALTLWLHSLAALLFGVLAAATWRHDEPRWPRRVGAAALGLSTTWALAVAGIGPVDVATRAAALLRDLGWLAMLATLARASGAARRPAPLYFAVAAVLLLSAGVAVAAPAPGSVLAELWGALRVLTLTGALLLVHHAVLTERARGDLRLLLAALALLWSGDLITLVAVLAIPDAIEAFAAARGGVAVAAALLIGAAVGRGADDVPALSRTAVWRTLGAIAVLGYAAGLAVAAEQARLAFGEDGRIAQTAVVFGGTTALLTLASSSWLRAWTRVKLAKHLFRHRYDYRVEWQRFSATLGAPGGSLDERVVRAVANLTDSPAGLLLTVDDDARLVSAEAWNWPDAPDIADASFARHLAGGRIVALDTPADTERAALPAALAGDPAAWIVVPLIHAEVLAGAIVLTRPPVPRALDWEDLDLLRVAGRQAASHLAEDRACTALAEAARFGEFNRRFAFLLHDIKNVASQLTLVARNAERHADNADFRADMVQTLRESAERMTALLARLGEHDAGRAEPSGAVDLAALARRVAAGRRAQHAVEVEVVEDAVADAQAGRLEQVLGHLVQNAIEAGATAPVRLVVRREGVSAAIEVVDRGTGMTAAFVRDALFRPFASTKPGGFGIGAFEARQLVRRMGGELRVESRVGEGTRFSVLLPASPALEAAA